MARGDSREEDDFEVPGLQAVPQVSHVGLAQYEVAGRGQLPDGAECAGHQVRPDERRDAHADLVAAGFGEPSGFCGRCGLQQVRAASGDLRHVRRRRPAGGALRVRRRVTRGPARPRLEPGVLDGSADRARPRRLLPLRHPLYQRPTLVGRLHWASTETATEYAGHVEGALLSGERAAHAVPSD
ncbi:FAD-dependent oxidoreductase [Streptomyces sp. NPDC006617]|uniref:FAD-dependent oxidoreductase n=1 Tax=Streptomyces sp. NPDC006617 TaxID=3155354 RepID=UPI00339EFF32